MPEPDYRSHSVPFHTRSFTGGKEGYEGRPGKRRCVPYACRCPEDKHSAHREFQHFCGSNESNATNATPGTTYPGLVEISIFHLGANILVLGRTWNLGIREARHRRLDIVSALSSHELRKLEQPCNEPRTASTYQCTVIISWTPEVEKHSYAHRPHINRTRRLSDKL